MIKKENSHSVNKKQKDGKQIHKSSLGCTN